MFAINSRLAAVKEALKSVVPGVTRAVVMERSWHSDREVFVSMLRESKAISPLEEVVQKEPKHTPPQHAFRCRVKLDLFIG